MEPWSVPDRGPRCVDRVEVVEHRSVSIAMLYGIDPGAKSKSYRWGLSTDDEQQEKCGEEDVS